jgi:hypothetical protein
MWSIADRIVRLLASVVIAGWTERGGMLPRNSR